MAANSGRGQASLYRLQGLKCALATNNLVLASTYAGSYTEFQSSILNCMNSKFTANDGKTTDENMRFDCAAPESYKRVCGEQKGTMCSTTAFLANWRSFPAGALVANITTQVCVPNECRDLNYEPTIQDYYNALPATSFCVNGTSPSSGVCFTQVQCSAPPTPTASAENQLAKNNEYNAGVIALLVIIVIVIVAGLVLVFVIKK